MSSSKPPNKRTYGIKFCTLFLPRLLPRLRELNKVDVDVLFALAYFAEINGFVKTSLKDLKEATAHHQSSISDALNKLCALDFIMKLKSHQSLFQINPDYLWIGSVDEYHGICDEALIEQGLEAVKRTVIPHGEAVVEYTAGRHEFDDAYLVEMLNRKRLWRQGKRKVGSNGVQ